MRQTNYQILTSLGLGATFLATVFQLTMNSRQWSEDHDLRITQDRIGQYADALKALESDKSGPANVSGIAVLSTLALQDSANYHSQVNEVLSVLLRQRAAKSRLAISMECSDDSSPSASYPDHYERGEALPEAQSAMSALGGAKFVAHREKFLAGKCESWTGTGSDLTILRLDHLYLDQLDLTGKDFSCANLTQSHFHQVSFRSAVLRGADFGGARIADFEVPGSPAASGTIGNKLYAPDGPPTWARYRCWVTDFRYADLTSANFAGTALAGADFEGADLTRANLCRADVSRANFTATKGLSGKCWRAPASAEAKTRRLAHPRK